MDRQTIHIHIEGLDDATRLLQIVKRSEKTTEGGALLKFQVDRPAALGTKRPGHFAEANQASHGIGVRIGRRNPTERRVISQARFLPRFWRFRSFSVNTRGIVGRLAGESIPG